MPTLRQLAALAATTAALCAAAPALAAPATVNLRVEGSTQTLFEGPVTTDAKTIHMDGDHPCDGTAASNGGTASSPSPTITTALDDGSIAGGFPWNGSWYDGGASFRDYFINSIGSDVNTTSPPYSPSWAYLLNWVYSSVGGCQQPVQQGDDVQFVYGDYGEPLLRLTAPQKAATGESFQVTVEQTDGSSGTFAPDSGATVDGATTDPQGHATISFPDAGNHTFKATHAGSIRSNAATVCVYAPGSGDCGTQKAPGSTDQPTPTDTTPTPAPGPAPAAKDTTPPVIHLGSVQDGRTYGKGPRTLSGTVDETGGIFQIYLRLRATDGGDLTAASRCRWYSGKRGVFTHRTVPCSRARFFRIGNAQQFSYLLPARLRHGKYVLDVKVLDRSFNVGRSSAAFGVK